GRGFVGAALDRVLAEAVLLVAAKGDGRFHIPEDASRWTVWPMWCAGFGKKLCSDLTPMTTVEREAGICGSLMLAICASPLTVRLWISVWKALWTWAAVPPKRMDMRSRVTCETVNPCPVSQLVTVWMSVWEGPNCSPIWSGVSHWW